MCGRSLKEGVMFVGMSSLLISLVLLFSSAGFLLSITRSDSLYNTQPMVAVNLIFTLVTTCLSLYQIVISVLLVWQARQIKGNIFLCSLWYVSHLSLLTIYCLLFSSKIVVYCLKKHYFAATLTIVIGIIYEGKIAINDKIDFDEDKPIIESESICTFITKHECLLNKGTVHMSGLCPLNSFHNYHRVCCILPLFPYTKQSHQSEILNGSRYKRSNDDEISPALKQRNALLQRKNFPHAFKNNQDSTTDQSKNQKIVTPSDYVDPYWNVKNFKFRQQNNFNEDKDKEKTKFDSSSKDYSDDYTAEVPKPGLLGAYTDRDERLTTWKMRNKAYSYDGYDEISEEDSGESDMPFGYSSFDPRQGNRKKNSRSKKRKPQRLMVTSTEENKGSESQTINFHSRPDFHVLHGFKLVNLSGNKNRFVRTTTETLCDSQDTSNENTFPEVENPDDIYDDTIDLDQQVYKDCGNSVTNTLNSNFKKTHDETNPWLSLVVLTKSPQTILCYATIVHPRAVITAAECVQGKIAGDVTVLTGMWKLKNDKPIPQHRMASVYIHSDYKPGELANDLSLLYWKRPLQLAANIQPACLADPHVGDDCYFVGWGGYDQGLSHHPDSQQATILTPRICDEKLSSPELILPPGAFCASVESRGTVTGIGGALLCKGAGGRTSIVGVAVYRDNIVVLLPTFEWVVAALRHHQII
ncbi:unnamed protein product [Danaus chrysippus]|uniref:(African queen) hypothetical protein n=1 Tax=Danaus chrysippus TaxID=151541 RepID=A0A8J2RI43_9NEOP|nr:unnamed protein product [Danaus chrysippus]